MPTIEIDGLRIAYRERGDAGPSVDARQAPILLVHGAGGSSLAWQDTIGRLGRARRTVALDLPGHGRSSAFAGPVAADARIGRFADVACALAERIGLGRFVIAGHSMGGAIALDVALRYGARLAGLCLVTTGAVMGVSDALFEVLEGRFDEVPRAFADMAYSPATSERDAARWAALMIQAPQDEVVADYRACALHDLRARLGEIETPTVVISGADDRLIGPKLQRRLVEGISGARLLSFDRAGHMVLQERPRELADAILSLG